jgi:hypothetical protein
MLVGQETGLDEFDVSTAGRCRVLAGQGQHCRRYVDRDHSPAM